MKDNGSFVYTKVFWCSLSVLMFYLEVRDLVVKSHLMTDIGEGVLWVISWGLRWGLGFDSGT
jgi:hypothetical protein